MADLWGEDDEEQPEDVGEEEEEEAEDADDGIGGGGGVGGAGDVGEDEEEEEEEDILDMGVDTVVVQEGALLMRFCPHDSSILYPQEDKRNKQLQYACRLCRYTEPAPNQPLVYRNERKKEVGNILHTVPSAISDDPTLARSQKANCANCGHHQAVFFQSDIAQRDSLALIFVCCNCDHKWVS